LKGGKGGKERAREGEAHDFQVTLILGWVEFDRRYFSMDLLTREEPCSHRMKMAFFYYVLYLLSIGQAHTRHWKNITLLHSFPYATLYSSTHPQ